MGREQPDFERLNEIFGDAPRNEWEEKERALIVGLHKFVFKDPRSIDAFCKLIFHYREEIARRKLLVKDFGEVAP